MIDASRLDKAERDVLRMAIVTEANRLRTIEERSKQEADVSDAKWRRFVLASFLLELGDE